MRGYRKMSASADPLAIARLNEELTTIDLGLEAADVPRSVFQGRRDEVELATRQFLLWTCGGVPLSTAILEGIATGERVTATIPGAWIRKLRDAGYLVDGVVSRIRFAVFVARRFYVGVRQLMRMTTERGASSPAATYAQFADLGPSNLP